MFRSLLMASVALCLFTLSATSHAQTYADSISGFSGEQGRNNWFYGYYDKTQDPDGSYNYSTDFKLMPDWWVEGWGSGQGLFWTRITADLAHPNGSITSGDRLPREQWAIRRWVSDVNSAVLITGKAAKVSFGGNGVRIRIIVDGNQVYEKLIGPDDNLGVQYRIATEVVVGSKVDFILDPYLGNDSYDGTRFTSLIAHDNPPVTIRGYLTLPNCQKMDQPMFLVLRPAAEGVTLIRTVKLSATGTFAIRDIPPAAYYLWVKGNKWLAKTVWVDATYGSVSGVNAELLPGDANNDNVVDIFDLGALAESFNATQSSPNWNGDADFNCDGGVNIFDLAILAENFNQQGDP